MPDLESFREETRRWLDANAPASMHTPPRTQDELCWGGRKSHYPADVKRWLDVMAERGWTAPTWPREYGGGGLSKAEAKVLAEEMDRRIVTSGARELDSLMRGLNGGFIVGGGGGEPIRNPDSYPTGKNFYGIDPDKVPKPASYDMGVKLADQMLADHLKKHGKYPEKVSFVIWGDETMRHEGVLESQIFHLLGTKPVWDVRGKVVDVEVIPRAKLGRPRVDIVIASAAEGMFNNVTNLMDQAVQKVKAIDEAENYVRNHYLATKAILIQRGYTEADADRRAGVRIFDEPPGTFNLNTSTIKDIWNAEPYRNARRLHLESGGPDVCRACDLPKKDSPLWISKLL